MNYEYDREQLENGAWDIDNPERTSEGEQVYLANEIVTALPGKDPIVHCDAGTADIDFGEVTLTAEEKTTLDTVVSDHKNNT
jgi:hypothetical protein